MKQKIVAIILIISFCSTFIYAQEEEIAIPYKPDEFPQWTVDLRRAEIITIGSFPLSFMFTALIYDISMAASNNFDPTIPFGSNRSQQDVTNLLLISAGVSVAIGLTDFIIHQVKRNNLEKEQQELDEQRKNNN